MGCDFYVYTFLEITHKEGIAYIELSKKRGWYCDCLEPDMDTDDEEDNYRKKCDEYFEIFLKPSFNPIIIYDGERFLKHKYVTKYLQLIHQKVNGSLKHYRDNGQLLYINDIQLIRKIELRETS